MMKRIFTFTATISLCASCCAEVYVRANRADVQSLRKEAALTKSEFDSATVWLTGGNDGMASMYDYSGNRADIPIVGNPCATFDGVATVTFSVDIPAGAYVLSSSGTAVPTVDAANDEITFTSGTCWDLILVDSFGATLAEIPMCERGGDVLHDVTLNENDGTLSGVTLDDFWNDNTQDAFAYFAVNGGTLTNGIYYPALIGGSDDAGGYRMQNPPAAHNLHSGRYPFLTPTNQGAWDVAITFAGDLETEDGICLFDRASESHISTTSEYHALSGLPHTVVLWFRLQSQPESGDRWFMFRMLPLDDGFINVWYRSEGATYDFGYDFAGGRSWRLNYVETLNEWHCIVATSTDDAAAGECYLYEDGVLYNNNTYGVYGAGIGGNYTSVGHLEVATGNAFDGDMSYCAFYTDHATAAQVHEIYERGPHASPDEINGILNASAGLFFDFGQTAYGYASMTNGFFSVRTNETGNILEAWK